MGKLCIQRNSSTPLLHGLAYTSLGLHLPSTWRNGWKSTNKTAYASATPKCFFPKISTWCYIFLCPPYLMPLLMVSVGAQLTASTQSVQWYCLLSRNQPESDSPRTWIPVCPSPSNSSATLSTFRRTPVPPALHTEIPHILINTFSMSIRDVQKFQGSFIPASC